LPIYWLDACCANPSVLATLRTFEKNKKDAAVNLRTQKISLTFSLIALQVAIKSFLPVLKKQNVRHRKGAKP